MSFILIGLISRGLLQARADNNDVKCSLFTVKNGKEVNAPKKIVRSAVEYRSEWKLAGPLLSAHSNAYKAFPATDMSRRKMK